MAKFKTKSRAVEAFQFLGALKGNEVFADFTGLLAHTTVVRGEDGIERLYIIKPSGVVTAEIGDWVIMDEAAEYSVRKGEEFAAEFESAMPKFRKKHSIVDAIKFEGVLTGEINVFLNGEQAFREYGSDKAWETEKLAWLVKEDGKPIRVYTVSEFESQFELFP